MIVPIKIYKQEKKIHNNYLRLCYCITYFLIFIISIILLFFYILFHFIPKNNSISMSTNNIFGDNLNQIFPFLYSLISSIILPFISNKIKCNSKYESFISMTVSMLFTFLLPIFFIFILSNNCCNLWVRFWEPCYVNLSETGQTNTFDVIQTKFPYESVLKHDVICGAKLNINSIEFDKCTRDVLHIISDLSVQKLQYSGVVLPIVSFSLQIFKITIVDFHSFSFFKPKNEENAFHTSLFQYIIYLILFGFACPLIIVIIYVSVFFNLIYFLFQKIYLNVKFKTSDYSYSINILYFVLFLHHLLSLMFWISNDFVLPEIMITFICVFWSVHVLSILNISFPLNLYSYMNTPYSRNINVELCDVTSTNMGTSTTVCGLQEGSIKKQIPYLQKLEKYIDEFSDSIPTNFFDNSDSESTVSQVYKKSGTNHVTTRL